jgi:hypothetical protein
MFTITEKSQAEKTNDVLRAFNDHSIQTLENYKLNYLRAFSTIWNNPEVSAQEIFDAMGHEAYKVFAIAQKVIIHIMDMDPTWRPTDAPNLFTVNED